MRRRSWCDSRSMNLSPYQILPERGHSCPLGRGLAPEGGQECPRSFPPNSTVGRTWDAPYRAMSAPEDFNPADRIRDGE